MHRWSVSQALLLVALPVITLVATATLEAANPSDMSSATILGCEMEDANRRGVRVRALVRPFGMDGESLRVGDVITRVAFKEIRSLADLRQVLAVESEKEHSPTTVEFRRLGNDDSNQILRAWVRLNDTTAILEPRKITHHVPMRKPTIDILDIPWHDGFGLYGPFRLGLSEQEVKASLRKQVGDAFKGAFSRKVISQELVVYIHDFSFQSYDGPAFRMLRLCYLKGQLESCEIANINGADEFWTSSNIPYGLSRMTKELGLAREWKEENGSVRCARWEDAARNRCDIRTIDTRDGWGDVVSCGGSVTWSTKKWRASKYSSSY